MSEIPERPPDKKEAVDRSEGFGERLLGSLLDRSHDMPPQLIPPLVAEEVGKIGGREVSLLLQDYAQLLLVPLPGLGVAVGDAQPIADSPAGAAFLDAAPVEVAQHRGVRMYIPLLDGSDHVGVLGVTLDTVDDDDRRLLRRLGALVANLLITKHPYTDQFFQARRREPMNLAAEMQWSLLPPLAMTIPQVEVAGILEPAYTVAGDSFDYVLNENILHSTIIDAMGHGLSAAAMAAVAISAYRHARRAGFDLVETYKAMDEAVDQEFGPESFVTAQMMRLDVYTGELRFVNAGHYSPLVIHDHKVVEQLSTPTTLPVGLNGEAPEVSEYSLSEGDRLLCYTDGVIEEHMGQMAFGEEQFINFVDRVEQADEGGVRGTARALSHMLKRRRGWKTSDDATLFLIEWKGSSNRHYALRE